MIDLDRFSLIKHRRIGNMVFYKNKGKTSIASNEYMVYFYDALGRQCIQGIMESDLLPVGIYDPVQYTDKSTALGGYQIAGCDNVTLKKILAVNYYDNYNFTEITGIPQSLLPAQSALYITQGMLTGNLNARLSIDSKTENAQSVTSVFYHDRRGNIVRSILSNPLGGCDVEDIGYSTQYTYDSMGNILTLKRNGLQDGGTYGLVNNLTYTYNGDRIVSITDDASDETTYSGAFHYRDRSSASVDRTYDANGNMTGDLDKDIQSIEYNSQNMPMKVSFGDGSTISYVYDANGNKLQKTASINKLAATIPATEVMQGGNASDFLTMTTRYVGNFVYENGTLSHILTDNGYVNFHTGYPQYHFYIKDHLGNNRVVADANGSVIQQNAYYALGGLMADQCINAETQPYKYNGKELDRMHGLDWYDHGARHNDAAIGRWHSMDPLCEKYYDFSPYVYCKDNPVNAIEPDGKDGIFIAFPDYKISTPIGKIGGLGYAGVLLINNKTGFTKYYEYGRYDSENRGVVRSFSVPNVDIDKNG